jgi:hypothetical protein
MSNIISLEKANILLSHEPLRFNGNVGAIIRQAQNLEVDGAFWTTKSLVEKHIVSAFMFEAKGATPFSMVVLDAEYSLAKFGEYDTDEYVRITGIPVYSPMSDASLGYKYRWCGTNNNTFFVSFTLRGESLDNFRTLTGELERDAFLNGGEAKLSGQIISFGIQDRKSSPDKGSKTYYVIAPTIITAADLPKESAPFVSCVADYATKTEISQDLFRDSSWELAKSSAAGLALDSAAIPAALPAA